MKTHYSNLEKQYFYDIKNGNKIYEIRLYDIKRQIINIGDIWIFKCNKNKVVTKVTDITIYNNFNEIFDNIDITLILPTINNINDGINIYHNIYYKNNHDNYKYKIACFKIDLFI
jgi:ASC-1-like (ASCH) protein